MRIDKALRMSTSIKDVIFIKIYIKNNLAIVFTLSFSFVTNKNLNSRSGHDPIVGRNTKGEDNIV